MNHIVFNEEMLGLFYFSPYFYETLSDETLVIQSKSDDRRFILSGNKIILEDLYKKLTNGISESALKQHLEHLFDFASEEIFEYMVLERIIE